VKPRYWLLSLGILCLGALACQANPIHWRFELALTNRHIAGKVMDHTHNHGADNRIWSKALNQKRDLYVYLPPCFDPCKHYPVMLWLHGLGQDEHSFLEYVVKPLDRGMVDGTIPPMIVAAPDGSIDGKGRCLYTPGSFYINNKSGRFEDYIIDDAWQFVLDNYPCLPERENHVIAGASMGGGGAFNLAMKDRDKFKIVIGIYPAVNTRWVDCHGNYRAKFDPNCWGWRTDVQRGREIIARFGPIAVRLNWLLDPIVNRDEPEQAIEDISRENPIEILDRLNVRPGELSMYIGYGGRDQFHMDSQVESFLYRACERGLKVGVEYLPNGRHDPATAYRLIPGIFEWLRPQLPDVR
jgi:S-formylglutathione hydrolase FrmB